MHSLTDRRAVPIPKALRARPRDARGYPIPYQVLVDKSGKAQFTINDGQLAKRCRNLRLCHLCGGRLERSVWFIGGARCFTLTHGAFVDGPVHHDCGAYALQVCPFLALPHYAKRIDTKKLDPADIPDNMGLRVLAHMPPAQPERFGFGQTEHHRAFDAGSQGWLYAVDQWSYVEWWRCGTIIDAPARMPSL